MNEHNRRASAAQTPALTSNTQLTRREVADLTGKHPDTIKDYIADGRYPNAVKEHGGRGTWLVPVKDLVAVGDLDPADVVEVAPRLEALRESREVSQLKAVIAELQQALEVEKALSAERKVTIDSFEAILTAALSRPLEPSGVLR